MNERRWLALIAACLLATLVMDRIVLASSLTKQEYIIGSDGIWFVEISKHSFENMGSQISYGSDLQGTIDNIRDGFAELAKSRPRATSLGFYWHKEHERSMCKLYAVKEREDNIGRELDMDVHYATIEQSEGSCRTNGLYLRQLVSFMTATNEISQNVMWGMMMPESQVVMGYRPILASIDEVWIPIGMVPLADHIEISEAWIPIEEWSQFVHGKVEDWNLASYFTNWKGVEAYKSTQTIDIQQWQEWITAVGPHISKYSRAVGWDSVPSYADTPPIGVNDWGNWLVPQATTSATIIPVVGWKTVEPMKNLAEAVEDGDWQGAVAAARVSEHVYGTPGYGMVVATICPKTFLRGVAECVLPKFEMSKAGVFLGDDLALMRVPFLRE